MTTSKIKSIRAALIAQMADMPATPEHVTFTTKTIETDGAKVSLTTDDRDSGHTMYTLRMTAYGSDCLRAGEKSTDIVGASTDLEVTFHYGYEGGALIEALRLLLK